MPGDTSEGSTNGYTTDFNRGTLDVGAIISINGSIPGTSSQFRFHVPDIWKNVDFPPLHFQISPAEHLVLERLVRQPNKLLNELKRQIKSQNIPGLDNFIDWFFSIARVAILKEILRQLKQPPPPPPPDARCCG
jgi:hypothetical protein